MPRFDNEGFNNSRNGRDDIDRTVPEDENYYGFSPIDLDFNSRERKPHTEEQGFNPCGNGNNDFINPPVRSRRQDAEYKPQPRRTNNSGDKKRKSGKVKVKAVLAGMVALVLVIVVAIAGSGVSVINKVNYREKQENGYVDASQLMSSSGVKNILLLGVDARSDDSAEASRSDVMLLVSLDADHNCIKMTSFLRDTWVYIPTLGYDQRLNAACSSGGYQGVVDAIEYNFGVDIDGYAVVDFEMFKVLVDSVGGVKVNITEEEAKEVTKHPKRYGNVTLDAGEYELTGEQALAYCRIRKIDTDFMRTKRQRTVLSAILKKAKSSPFKLYSMASNSAPYIETNFTKSELMSIATKAFGCLGGEFLQDKVPFEGTWWYANINGNSVISIDVDKNKEKLKDYIYNKTAEEILAEQAE